LGVHLFSASGQLLRPFCYVRGKRKVHLENPNWHILLIDEDEDDCLLTRDMLRESRGRRIDMDWAENYEAGLQSLKERAYDAVLVDYDLKPHTGVELIRQLAQEDYPAPLIMYSGQAVYEVELEALQAGATAYLSKREATPLLLERLIRYAIERKKSETDLRESERRQRELAEQLAADQQKLEAVLKHLPVGVWIIGPQGEILSKNLQADQIWAGQAPLLESFEEYPEYPVWWIDRDERLRPEEYPAAQAVMTGKPVGPVEVRNQRFDGSSGRILVSAAPIHDRQGNLTGAVAINLDITQQRQAEEELRWSEERFAKAFRASPMAFAISRLRDGYILDVNESYERLLGYPRSESVGKTSTELGVFVNPVARTLAIQLLQEQGYLRNYEMIIRTRKGEERMISLSAEVIEIDQEPHILSLFHDITIQHRAQEALQKALAEAEEGKRLLHALLEHIPEGIAITSGPPDFRIKHISRRGIDMLGRDRDKIINHPAGYHQEAWGIRLLDGKTTPTTEQMPLYRATRQGIETNNFEMILERKDGQQTPILMNAAPIRNQEGQIVAAINCWLDITERKKAEALAAQKVIEAETAAREAEQRRAEMDALFEQMDEAVVLFGLDDSPLRVNGRVIEMFGFDPVGMPPAEIAAKITLTDEHGWSIPSGEFIGQRSMRGETIRGQTLRFKSPTGNLLIVSASGRPFFNSDGEIAGGLVTWHDITEREQAAKALRESEERFRLARQAIEGVVYDWDPVNNQVIQLDGAREILGLSEEKDFPTDPAWWQQRIHPDDAENARQQLQNALQGRSNSIDSEYRLRHHDGHWIHIWDRAFTLKDEGGQVIRVVGLAVDVSERKAAESRALFLQQLGRDLNAMQHTQEAGQMVVERLGQFLDVDRCLIVETDLENKRISVRFDHQRDGYHGAVPTKINFDLPELSGVFQSGMVLAIEDAKKRHYIKGVYKRFLEPLHIRSIALVALNRQDNLDQLLVVACKEPHRWSDQTQRFLQQAGRLAWLAIERVQVSERLRISEERFRIALDQAPTSVFSQDRDLRFTWVFNPIGGFDAEDLIGKLESDLVPTGQMEGVTALKREVLEQGQPRTREFHVLVGENWMDVIMNIRPTFEAGQVTGIIGTAMDVTDIRRLQAQQIENETRVQVQRWLMEHREQERMKIARNLHDKPLQDLLAVHLYLNNISDSLSEQGLENMAQAHRMLEEAIEEIRSLALELRPPMLMHMGLEKAMRAFAHTFRQRNPNLLVQLDLEQDQQNLSEDVRLALYRIFQELLKNVGDHAEAGEVTISLHFEPHEVVLTVQDDGAGFETPESWIELASRGRMGLVGINERMEFLNGSFYIETRPGDGTKVEVRVPVGEGATSE
jgi:PAS domain S-box-containing protein